MATIDFGKIGIASGIDTQSMVNALMQFERQPVVRLEQKTTLYSTRKSILQDINTKLLSFYNASKTFFSAFDDVWSSKTVVSSDSNLLGVSVTPSATASTYDIVINKLAKAHTVRSDSQTSSTSKLYLNGDFTINGKTISVTYTDTLQSIQNKINSTTDIGVTASIVDNALRIKSNQTGVDYDINLSDVGGATSYATNNTNPAVLSANVTGTPTLGEYAFNVTQLAIPGIQDAIFTVTKDGVETTYNKLSNTFSDVIAGVDITLSQTGTSMLTIYKQDEVLKNLGVLNAGGAVNHELVQALDAEIEIDGQIVTRSTNIINDVISGVTLTLKGESATAVTATISTDVTSIKSKITDWVNSYNAAYKLVSDKLAESTVRDPKTDSDRQKGAFRSDSQLLRIKTELRRLLGSTVSGLPQDTSLLSQIGIDFETNGQMTIDDETLTNALNTDVDKVNDLLTANYSADPYAESSSGLAVRVKYYLNGITDKFTGDIAERQKTIDSQITAINESIERWEKRLAKTEASYKKQFSEMEKAIQGFQSQGKWLSGQLASLQSLQSQRSFSTTSGSVI